MALISSIDAVLSAVVNCINVIWIMILVLFIIVSMLNT